jgi:hypothetical protein
MYFVVINDHNSNKYLVKSSYSSVTQGMYLNHTVHIIFTCTCVYFDNCKIKY